jgi:hypothetical protein
VIPGETTSEPTFSIMPVMSAHAVAHVLRLRPDRVRDWARRGLIGRVCDVQSRVEGLDVREVRMVDARLRKDPTRFVMVNYDEDRGCTGPRCRQWAVRSAPVPLCRKHLFEAMMFASRHYAKWNILENATDSCEPIRELAATQGEKVLPPDSVVYFIQRGRMGPIKIGTTVNLVGRLSSLSANGSDVLLTLRGSYVEERALHEVFKADRIDRTEWFRPSEDLLSFIGERVRKAA